MSDHEPDFRRLGIETPWSAQEWRAAWNSLSEPRLWLAVFDMATTTWTAPTAAAAMLERGYDPPDAQGRGGKQR